LPVSADVVVKEYVAEVAPEMSAHVVPLVLTCHCTDGVGEPLAAALKLAVAPDVTVLLAGCVVTAGSVCKVNVAALVVTFPAAFVKIA
jgi:2-keto-4-pentenoate hydratase